MSKKMMLILLRLIFAVVVLCGSVGLLARTHYNNSPITQQRKTPKLSQRPNTENNYLFSERLPDGDWIAQAEFDISQNDL
jgi:hypothetical protein